MATTYKDSGVDVDKGKEAVDRIIPHVKKTFTPSVLTGLGLFGSLYDLTSIVKEYDEPVLVQSIDGVGTKMEVAGMMDNYEQVGRDIVAHSCNDVLCQGGKPLTFLDYVATDKLDPEILERIVKGMADECAENGMSLVGGETAEMPGTYNTDSIDVAGCVTGVVEKSKLLDGSAIKAGDVLIGLAAAGLHTNGFSLARKVLFEDRGFTVRTFMDELPKAVGVELMREHRNYTKALLPLVEAGKLHGMAHITGGGLVENLPRILADGLQAELDETTWPNLPILEAIETLGEVPREDMIKTFNMGIGMIAVVAAEDAEEIVKDIESRVDYGVYTIGTISELTDSTQPQVCFV